MQINKSSFYLVIKITFFNKFYPFYVQNIATSIKIKEKAHIKRVMWANERRMKFLLE